MAQAERITLTSGRVTFKMLATTAPQAFLDSPRWTLCEDGFLYQNGGFFEGRSICEELNSPPPIEVFPPGFVLTYGPEQSPRDMKRPWRQALSTWFDDALPFGMDRDGAKRITSLIAPYGLPSARFFRHRRADGITRERVLIRLDATQHATLRYLDYAAEQTSDERLDDLVCAWQSIVALTDPKALPVDAVFSPWLPPSVVELLESARA